MNLLSLDASTKSTGVAVFQEDQLIYYECITSSSTDVIKRINIMKDGIKKIIQKYNINKIIIEEVRPEGGSGVGNQKTHKALMFLQAAIAFLAHDDFNNLPIEYIYPSSWRAKLGIKNGRGIKRTSLKEADIEYVKNKYNIEVNDDIADAICIGLSYFIPEKNNDLNWGE